MKLSEDQELVRKFKQILGEYPGLEYDERESARMDNMLRVKVSTEVKYDIRYAVDIARKLSESTGDEYKVQPRSSSSEFSLDNVKSFGLFLLKPNRNVRITYPDSKHGKLEVDVIQGVEISLKIDDTLWCFAEGNELKIHFNIFAQSNYRKFLRSHVTKFTRNYNASADDNYFLNFDFKFKSEQVIDDNTDLSK